MSKFIVGGDCEVHYEDENEIKNRKGKIVNGVFVKESDLH